MSVPAKQWRLLPHDASSVGRLAREASVPPIVAQLLLNRGVNDHVAAKRFLESPLKGLHPPAQLPGVAAAAQLLHGALKDHRKICVYGDYDVDGVTGAAQLKQVLQLAGGTVEVYVPHRLDEGYGLNAEALRQIAANGTSVVVTVDCGIASIREAVVARELGLTLIVTDHHEMKEVLPDAAAVVHPRLPGTQYPFCFLSGSAVAFKLGWHVAQLVSGSERVRDDFKELLLDNLALAALGVVADVVPLWDENRILVKHGLARLQKSPPLGMKALIEAAKLSTGPDLRASDIAFKLAPRLNAAGRLGCARLVVDLLTTKDPQRANEIAHYLEEQNAKRQAIEREITRSAREMVDAQPLNGCAALVLASPHWHAGVIGIVASRIVGIYGRPALMIALDSETATPRLGHGSGRSVPGFALHEALRECGEMLVSHGGHHQAAGFKIHADQIDAFRERFQAHASHCFPNGLPPPPQLTLDVEAPLSALTVKLVKDLDRLEPYGCENDAPMFLAGDLRVDGEPRKVGNGERHLSFRVRQGDICLKAIAFGMADRAEELMSAGGACSLAFTPKINEYQGRWSVDLVVEDLQAGAQARLE